MPIRAAMVLEANYECGVHIRTFSAKRDFSTLVRMLPIGIILPITPQLTMALPSSGCTDPHHEPFGTMITIHSIKDDVDVLASLQKPKKVRFLMVSLIFSG